MPTRGSYRYQKQYLFDPDYSQVDGSSLWQRFGAVVNACDPQPLVYTKQDFDQITIGSNTIPGWTFTSVTSGSIAGDTSNPGGAVNISAGAATANQGVNWQLNQFPLKLASGKPVAFEAYGTFSGLSNLRLQTFIGLAASSTALIASGAVASVDRIGFLGITTTGVLSAVSRSSSTGSSGTGVTLVNATAYRFGIFATTTQVDFYINGSVVSSLTTSIPTTVLAPTIVVQANGTDTPVFNLDWVAWGGVR